MVRKDVLDFCYIIEEGAKTLELKKYLEREGFKAQCCGLSKLEHFRDTYALYYDYLAEMKNTNPKFSGGNYGYRGIATPEADDVHTSEIPKFALRNSIMFFNRDAYSTHCKEYKEFEVWKENHNEQRYVDVKNHGQKIDGKNMLHCQRLLDMAIEIATTKTIAVKRPNSEYLLSIRRGEVDLETLITKAEEQIKELDEVFENSSLPEEVDRDFVNKLLLEIRHL